MTVQELYDHITNQLTPEQALKKMLESSLVNYEQLKFDDKKNAIHPLIVISMATIDLGWGFVVEKGPKEVQGLIIGTKRYMNRTCSKIPQPEPPK